MQLTCEKNKLTGVVDFSKIPSELAYLDVSDNAIEGTAPIVGMQHMCALRAQGTKIAFQAYGVLSNGKTPDGRKNAHWVELDYLKQGGLP